MTGFSVQSGLGCYLSPTVSNSLSLPLVNGEESFSFQWAPRSASSAALRSGAGAPWASLSMGSLAGTGDSGSSPRPPPTGLFLLAEAATAKPLTLKRVVIKGDGRCMFRAMAQGLARNKGAVLRPAAEEVEADQLRLAVAEALCRSPKRRAQFKEGVKAMEMEGHTLPKYCERLQKQDFWGGETELLVLSKMLKVPLFVYLPESELGAGDGYRPLMKYGEEFAKSKGDRKARKPVRLLFCGGNHYDLLLRV